MNEAEIKKAGNNSLPKKISYKRAERLDRQTPANQSQAGEGQAKQGDSHASVGNNFRDKDAA